MHRDEDVTQKGRQRRVFSRTKLFRIKPNKQPGMKKNLTLFVTILFLCSFFFSCNNEKNMENNESTTVSEMTDENQKPELPGDLSLPTSAEELLELIKESKGDFKYSVEDFFRVMKQDLGIEKVMVRTLRRIN